MLFRSIAGEAPILYLQIGPGVDPEYRLVDGFHRLALDTVVDFRIDGDYPRGTYVLSGIMTITINLHD